MHARLEVKPEKEHFDSDKALFSKAMIVIGPHGGAFSNLIFMQPNSYVVEFNAWQSSAYRPYFYGLAQANALHYYYLAPSNFAYGDWWGHESPNHPMLVDIDHLDEIMRKITKRTSHVLEL